jgi:hypothetical protein
MFVIRGAHLARSIIENACWKGLDQIFRKIVEIELKEVIKAFRFLQARPHGASVVKSYNHLKTLALMIF